MATGNSVISAIATVFSEAHLREDILRNPTMKFRPVAYDRQERGVLTVEEYRKQFGTIWARKNHQGEDVPDELSHDVFEFAALTGMRCSEVLCMVTVEQLQGRILVTDRAFKGKEDGRPKHEKIREIILCQTALEIAHRYPKGFRLEDGSRLGATWWRKRSAEGLEQKEIKAGDRVIVPHSLRHSLATHLARNGVNLLLIQLYLWGKRVGTGARGTTESLIRVRSIYMHLDGHMTEPVARKIDELFRTKDGEAKSKGA